VHAGLLAALLLWFRHAPVPASGPQTEGAVELLLVEHRGSGPPAALAAPTPPVTVQAPPVPPVPPPPAVVQAPPLPPVPRSPPMPQVEAAKEALPRPNPPTPPPTLRSPPIRPQTQQAPRISLGGNDETDAIALGPHVIPASIDAKYHNREPVYPPDAARRSQQGAVILLIHVSPDGLPAGVDVAQTSGFTSLDRAAREAVLTWHFLPAIRDGSPIAFDMALRVVFHLQ
ncbi:MAG TPA: energy transducer TonB, partial [Acetobacteraceae bacterium]